MCNGVYYWTAPSTPLVLGACVGPGDPGLSGLVMARMVSRINSLPLAKGSFDPLAKHKEFLHIALWLAIT